MEEYKLELKQIVDYPRCRMYRQFILNLIGNKNLRVNGNSHLYYYTISGVPEDAQNNSMRVLYHKIWY